MYTKIYTYTDYARNCTRPSWLTSFQISTHVHLSVSNSDDGDADNEGEIDEQMAAMRDQDILAEECAQNWGGQPTTAASAGLPADPRPTVRTLTAEPGLHLQLRHQLLHLLSIALMRSLMFQMTLPKNRLF